MVTINPQIIDKNNLSQNLKITIEKVVIFLLKIEKESIKKSCNFSKNSYNLCIINS